MDPDQEADLDLQSFNLLHTCNPINGYFGSEDPDGMEHNVAFHHCLHCLVR